jgi:methylated-DNA-[protein]-cysteine S-methyltransferase
VETPIGTFGVEASEHGLRRVRLPGDPSLPPDDGRTEPEALGRAVQQLEEYARGERTEFDLPLDWAGVAPDHRRVLEMLREVAPYGHTVTYGELGARSGVEDPRDVGVHMNRNPLPIVVPCHRVVASDGLGGYGGGLALKRRLLELEGVLPASLDLGGV